MLCPNCIGPEAAAQAGADWLNTDDADPPPPPKSALAPPIAALDDPTAALDATKPAPDAPSARPLDPPKGEEKAGAEPGCDPIPLTTPPAQATHSLTYNYSHGKQSYSHGKQSY